MSLIPLAAALVFAAALTARYPIPIWIVLTTLATGLLLLLISAGRGTIFLLAPFVIVLAVAFIMPLPLPTSWPPVVRLGVQSGGWTLLLVLAWHTAKQFTDKSV